MRRGTYWAWFISMSIGMMVYGCSGDAKAGSVIRVQCTEEGAEVKVDGKFKGECSRSEWLNLMVEEGSHLVEAVKDNGDGSSVYYGKQVRIGDGVSQKVVAQMEKRYTEGYYIGQARKSGQVKDYETLLEKYPKGEHVKESVGELVGILLKLAEGDLAAGRLTSPEGSNAQEKYRRVLELDRENREAKSGQEKLEGRRQEMLQAWSKPRQGATAMESSTGMEFVWVPGGTYEMGCGSWSSDCSNNEKPVHRVVLKGFWAGKYEVTQGQWQSLMGSNPSNFSSCGADCPVEQVSWEDVQGFIKKLNDLGDGSFRLLTEAEWEYACRSGGKEEKHCGGANADKVAWYHFSGNGTHPVGKKVPNGLGLYDMNGNVSEWVLDWYSDNYYANSPRDNPQGPSSGSRRVNRGAGWNSDLVYVHSTLRGLSGPGDRYWNLGFRLSRTNP